MALPKENAAYFGNFLQALGRETVDRGIAEETARPGQASFPVQALLQNVQEKPDPSVPDHLKMSGESFDRANARWIEEGGSFEAAEAVRRERQSWAEGLTPWQAVREIDGMKREAQRLGEAPGMTVSESLDKLGSFLEKLKAIEEAFQKQRVSVQAAGVLKRAAELRQEMGEKAAELRERQREEEPLERGEERPETETEPEEPPKPPETAEEDIPVTDREQSDRIKKYVFSNMLIGNLDGLTVDERKVVVDLLDAGNIVEIIPRSDTQKMPDYYVNGVKTELKTLNGHSLNTPVTRIQNAFKQGAENVIIDARKTDITIGQAQLILKRALGLYGGSFPGTVEIWTKDGKEVQ